MPPVARPVHTLLPDHQRGPPMSRVAIVVATAVFTAAVTSVFWIYVNSSTISSQAESNSRAKGDEKNPASSADDSLRVGDAIKVAPSGLAIPVAGVSFRQLVDTYSEARAGGARLHDAIDIMAEAGTPVIAAAPGKVAKLFFSEGGGGITAYVRSDDGRWMYYYAHLQGYAPGLAEGQSIRRGQMIGRVGSTGNANAKGPHLHFAISQMAPNEKWWQGTPLNPYTLLAARPAD
jgi:peptidoglycan LD-endopeptidase LytH